VRLQFGLDAIRNYRRLSYKPWYALAEFVDNSTQSYFNNEAALKKAYKAKGEKLSVRIVYDRNEGFIRISDNAMGMSYKELEDALTIGKAPANPTGRSQFGMGLKTAATWFGNEWKVATKKLGEETEYEAVINVERIAEGDPELPFKETPKPKDLHYTIIEISDLNVKLHGRTLGKVKDYLKSMYRVDLRQGWMELFWEGSPLTWDDDTVFMKAKDGAPYKRDFKFEVDGKDVHGWIGVLGPGSSGRPNAGFTMMRFNRMIKGWPDAWRPEEIFGQIQGSNDLINQRVTGEIHLDQFEVSQAKDDIQWAGSQEDEVQKKLAEVAADFVAVARQPRKSADDARGPTEAEVQAAVDELRNEMESQEFIDLIEIDTVPPPEIIEESTRPMIEAVAEQEPSFVVTIGDSFVCKTYLTMDTSPNDPYYTSDAMGTARTILVVVNRSHPQWSQLGDSESVLTYLRHCVYDAIAEWQCRRMKADIQPNTIKALKDNLLRLPSRIEEHASAIAAEA
jgi:hypothetical protein